MDLGIELDPATFAHAFPFGLVAAADGTLEVIGRALERRLGAPEGRRVGDLFEVLRPRRVTPDASMVKGAGRTIRLRVRAMDLDLRGHAFWTRGEERFCFLGTPVVNSAEELTARGLGLADFDPTNTTPDMLLSVQAAQSALDDARRLADELRVALHQAEAGIEAKSRFLAVMSHEIRTPLNGFGSMLDLVREEPNRADADDLLRTMDECARGLTVLLNDILDFAKLEDRSVQIESIPFDLDDLLRAAVGPFRASAEAKNIELDIERVGQLPACLVGDPHRLRQILSNLVGNAVKFTSEGYVVVRVGRVGDVLRVDVRDTGAGIPAAAVDKLFEPFTQADASTTRRFGGTGLGLTISRQLARLMGGELELSHTGPEGTTFSLRVPAPATRCDKACAEAPGEARRELCSFEGLQVLVAEDTATNRFVVERLLRRLGATVHSVEDGAAAVEALERKSYDVVLMDMMMPVMDGATAARRIRDLPVAWRNLPIVAFTASAFAEDRERARDAGMDGFLEKPVRLESLERALVEAVGEPEGPRSTG